MGTPWLKARHRQPLNRARNRNRSFTPECDRNRKDDHQDDAERRRADEDGLPVGVAAAVGGGDGGPVADGTGDDQGY